MILVADVQILDVQMCKFLMLINYRQKRYLNSIQIQAG